MKQKQYIFQSLPIEMVIVLLASIISFPAIDLIGTQPSAYPIVLMVSYGTLKLFYYFCIYTAQNIVRYAFIRNQKTEFASQPTQAIDTPKMELIATNNNDILKKRMELFHHEYQHEQQQYLLQKEKKESEKLQAVLQYTRNTFKQLDFDEAEVFQICECVRYFVTTHQVLSTTEIHIKKRVSVTQISLKNFAWNIAFQYNIGGDATTAFVIATFSEWFANSTFNTIKKNLRTTTGQHKINIDENFIIHSTLYNKN